MQLADIDSDGSIDCLYISNDDDDIKTLRTVYDLAAAEQLRTGAASSNGKDSTIAEEAGETGPALDLDTPTPSEVPTDNKEEFKFSNQNWKRVLKEIVDYAPNRYGRGKDNFGQGHPLIKRLRITPYELMMIMSFLEEMGLIEYDQQEHNWINLTARFTFIVHS